MTDVVRASVRAGAPAGECYPADECYIVIGNHDHYHGIGEIVYTLDTYFSGRYKTQISESIVPDRLNVIIDEFSTPERVEFVKALKQQYPLTRFVLMATEFITTISLLGFGVRNTFNFFDVRDDARHLLSLLAYGLHLKANPPYLYARYRGFVQALAVADLVLCAHPGISETMQLLPDNCMQRFGQPLTLYPEINHDRVAQDRRLYRRAAGFVTTGTLTSFRKTAVSRMVAKFRQAGIQPPFHRHVAFNQTSDVRFDNDTIDLGYDEIAIPDRMPWPNHDAVENYLYNLNPPQRTSWPYSSPMRILRAILRGQIPVVTSKFADHAIEQVALVWDGQVETAKRMWLDATQQRPALVARHLAAVAAYNQVAKQNNAAIDQALDRLDLQLCT